MHDWNIVVTVRNRGFVAACELLEPYGQVAKTDFFNVLVMKAEDPRSLMDALKARFEADAVAASVLARLIPVEHTFSFQTADAFRPAIIPLLEPYVPRLKDKAFYTRMRRRGFKGRLSSMEEEKFLDDHLRECLARAGSRGRVSFENPDAVLSVETVGQRGGVGLWTRDDLETYPFLRFD
jgi:tRNA(Ser,Leu) C12 N-acetylase TAN1